MADRFDEIARDVWESACSRSTTIAAIATALRELAAAEREAGFAAGEKLGLERAATLAKEADEGDERDNGAAATGAAQGLADRIRSLPLTPKE